MKAKNSILIFIITIYVIIQFSLIFINQGLWWDEAVYLGLSENIRDGIYSLSSSNPVEAFRAPLFPLISSIFGANSNAILFSRLIPFFFFSLSILALYKTGKEIFPSRESGLISVLILVSFPLFIYYSNKFLTESLFVFIFSVSLYLFSKTSEKDSKNFPFLLGILTGLAFLTRYIGIILVPLYIGWFTYKRKIRRSLLVFIGFLVSIIPWTIYEYVVFGNPFWGFLVNLRIYSTMADKPLLYYLMNSYQIFGPLFFVVFIGYVFSIKDILFQRLKENKKIVLYLAISIPVIFTLLGNKNIRYLVSFYPIFCLLVSAMLVNVEKYGSKVYNISILFVVLLSIGSFYTGYERVLRDHDSGLALKEAGLYIRRNTNKNDVVLTQIYSSHYPEWNLSSNNPWIRVIGNRKTIPFPESKEDLKETMGEYGIEYVLIYNFGPRVPKYSKGVADSMEFVKIKSFEQWNNEDAVVIYRYTNQSS